MRAQGPPCGLQNITLPRAPFPLRPALVEMVAEGKTLAPEGADGIKIAPDGLNPGCKNWGGVKGLFRFPHSPEWMSQPLCPRAGSGKAPGIPKPRPVFICGPLKNCEGRRGALWKA